jgi:hypothetical protein
VDNQANNHQVVNLTKTLKQVLHHTSFGIYPPKLLSGPPSTMHKQRVVEVSSGQNTSLTQTQKRQKLEDNDLKQIATHDSRKLS